MQYVYLALYFAVILGIARLLNRLDAKK